MKDALIAPPHRMLRAGALAGMVVMALFTSDRDGAERATEPAQPSEVLAVSAVDEVAPALGELTPIALERRWLVGASTLASPADVDAALGVVVAPWEEFAYLADAQPRNAIASETYASTDAQPVHEFGVDEYGGIWRIARPSGSRGKGAVTYTRDVYLLPSGSSFRGVVTP